MKTLNILLLIGLGLITGITKANTNEDSISVFKNARNLAHIFKTVDHREPNIVKFGKYYHAADYLTMDGNKAADYTKEPQRAFVDSLCTRLDSILSNNHQCVFGDYIQKSPTIHHITMKYRDNMHHKFSLLDLVFIKSDDEYLLIGLEKTSRFHPIKLGGH